MATLIRGDGRTVNAYQDSILGDFAFSGKDGIVKDVGQACGLDTTTLNSVKVKSGMVVIQGRQITLDGTDSISLPIATGSTVYWTTLYLELDLSAIADDELMGKVTLKKLEYTSSYPAVPTSDNLKVQTAGKAYIGLYRFKNTANGVNSVEQIANIIDSTDMFNNIALKLVADFGDAGKSSWRRSELELKVGKKYRVVWSVPKDVVSNFPICMSEAIFQDTVSMIHDSGAHPAIDRVFHHESSTLFGASDDPSFVQHNREQFRIYFHAIIGYQASYSFAVNNTMIISGKPALVYKIYEIPEVIR